MSRLSRLIPLFATTVLLAACGSSGSDTPLSPASNATHPSGRHDDSGGPTMGGNFAPGAGSGSSTANTTASDSSTALGGGPTMGGN